MTEKELKKFSRAALIKLVLERTRENEELRQQLRIVGDKLASRGYPTGECRFHRPGRVNGQRRL